MTERKEKKTAFFIKRAVQILTAGTLSVLLLSLMAVRVISSDWFGRLVLKEIRRAWPGGASIASISLKWPIKIVVEDLQLYDSGPSPAWLRVESIALYVTPSSLLAGRLSGVEVKGCRLRLRYRKHRFEPLCMFGSSLPVSAGVLVLGDPPPVASTGVFFDRLLIDRARLELAVEGGLLPLRLDVDGIKARVKRDPASDGLSFSLQGKLQSLGSFRLSSGMPGADGQRRIAVDAGDLKLNGLASLFPSDYRGQADGLKGRLKLHGEAVLQEARTGKEKQRRARWVESKLRLLASDLLVPSFNGTYRCGRADLTLSSFLPGERLSGSLKLRKGFIDLGSDRTGVVDLACDFRRDGGILRIEDLRLLSGKAQLLGQGFLSLGDGGLLQALLAGPSYELEFKGADFEIPVAVCGGGVINSVRGRAWPGAIDCERIQCTLSDGRFARLSGTVNIDDSGAISGSFSGTAGRSKVKEQVYADVAGSFWAPSGAFTQEEARQ